MKITRIRRNKSDALEAGTLSDLAFLLIIYFIVIAGFNINQGFMFNLAGKDSVKLVFKDDAMQIDLDQGGNLWLQAQSYQMQELANLMSQVSKTQPNLTVLLRIHPDASWQSVVNFMDVIQEKGIVNFSFVLNKDATGVNSDGA